MNENCDVTAPCHTCLLQPLPVFLAYTDSSVYYGQNSKKIQRYVDLLLLACRVLTLYPYILFLQIRVNEDHGRNDLMWT